MQPYNVLACMKGIGTKMNSRVTIKEIVSMLLIIVAFTATGIMIMNQDYKYALLALAFTAFCVLIGFAVIIVDDLDRILDMSNPSLRNPRKSGSNKRVKYISRLTPDMAAGGRRKSKSSKDDLYVTDVDDKVDDFYESVGNMRVYKRGEEIEFHDRDEEE